ncbi:SHOCT domain-containing protein [Leifsonia sp. TF02-11]|uniref:SHOCT domain-containing protein n=1 Tax=Leifsonia sp. TF02-11 TaxID=2815212 RepID=UPI001AA1A845|nr:SHOCT domain-containing protein [Leifsonia sp. TF02-11]MBO1738001.1 SHOCT domain-containing protein [Leifsonia sp. TF02-11]
MPLLRRFGRPGLIGLAVRTAVVAGTATAVTGGMVRHQQRRSQEQYEQQQYEAGQQQQAMQQAAADAVQQQTPAPSPAPGGEDMLDQLTALTQLHQQGALTDAEFTAAKAKLLG